jgi:hypothetical protein
MKKKYLKILIGVILVAVLVLIYTQAVTQTSKNEEKFTSNIAVTANNDKDTADIGEPTGDDPWKELDNLVKAYYIKDGVFYQGTMKLYDDNGDNEKLLEEKKFEYTYFNNQYSYSLGPLEVVNKKDYAVIVNHDDKIIAVTPKITSKAKNKELLNLSDFKKILQEQNANTKVTRRGNEKVLTIDSIQDPDIQGYRIYYSPETYKINRILIGMVRLSPMEDEASAGKIQDDSSGTNSPGADEIDGYYYYLEINYSTMKPLSLHAGGFNPENKFVRIDGKKIELTPEFKEYRLYNSEE